MAISERWLLDCASRCSASSGRRSFVVVCDFLPQLGRSHMTSMANRYDPDALQASVTPGTVVVASSGIGPFDQILLDGRHRLRADEPAAVGGADAGPGPYELL